MSTCLSFCFCFGSVSLVKCLSGSQAKPLSRTSCVNFFSNLSVIRLVFFLLQAICVFFNQSKKAAKTEIDAQVAALLDLKKQLAAAGGESPNDKGKDDKKKAKQPPQQKTAPAAKKEAAAPTSLVPAGPVMILLGCVFVLRG